MLAIDDYELILYLPSCVVVGSAVVVASRVVVGAKVVVVAVVVGAVVVDGGVLRVVVSEKNNIQIQIFKLNPSWIYNLIFTC